MRTTSARRTITKILATVALVGGAASVAGIGTYGAFTDTTTADTAITSGKVSVLMNGSDAGIHVDASQLAAGDAVVFPLSMTRPAGTLALSDVKLTTATTGSSTLTSAMRLTVDSCTTAWTVTTSAVSCGGTQTNVSTNGPLGDNGSTSAWAQTASWLTALNNNIPINLRVTLTLDPNATDAVQGQTAGLNWTVTGTQRTAKTTVVTPTAS